MFHVWLFVYILKRIKVPKGCFGALSKWGLNF